VHFDERTEGDYRIYAGALEAPNGHGYIAALVITRLQGRESPREAYRDTALAGGHRWDSPQEALSYAMEQARAMIRSRTARLTC
jgi:hypothetical protein